MRVSAAGQTHPGCVRTRNEDAYLIHEMPSLLAVADGMGGHDAGDLASAMLVAELREATGTGIGALVADTTARIARVNDALLRRGRGEWTIGSTIVCIVSAGDGAAVLWVGDSRAYLLRNRHLTPLTNDHSVVQDMVDAGTITPEEARGHPLSNRITRAVGVDTAIDIDSRSVTVQEDDRLILCSDGLTDCLTDEEIAAYMRFRDDRGACEALIAAAVARGAPDNVTVLCATVAP